MSIKINFLVLTVCSLLFSAACCKKKYDPIYESTLPLKIGNYWQYEESYYYPDSSQNPNSVRNVKIEIVKDTTIEDNILAFVVEQTYENNRPYRYLWFVVGNEIREQYIGAEVYSVIYKTDMKVGDEWTRTPHVTNQGFNTRKVTDYYPELSFLNTTVAAFKVQNGNANLNEPNQYGELSEDVFAPGIGVIESDYRINFYGPSRTHRVLTEYFIQ